MNSTAFKVGLALGGGAARGLAHIGVIQVLEKEHVPVSLIAGTSMGALVGAIYARHGDASLLEDEALATDWRRVARLMDPALPRSGFIAGKRIARFLEDMIGTASFEDLRLPLYCIASDIMTGDEVVIGSGPVVEGVQASISVPVIFNPVYYRGRFLVDGGLVDSVPAGVAKERGAQVVIAVNVMPYREKPGRIYLEEDDKTRDGMAKPPGLFTIVTQIIATSRTRLVNGGLEDADIVIDPPVTHLGLTDFGRASDFIEAGREAARAALPQIKKRLGTA